jgi:hypothetical protein
MITRTVTMSHSELDRFGVITRVRERRLTQIEAARILDSAFARFNGFAWLWPSKALTVWYRASAAGPAAAGLPILFGERS